MSVIVADPAVALDTFETFIGSANVPELQLLDSGRAQLVFGDDTYDELEGRDLVLSSDGEVLSGTINRITEFQNGQIAFMITDLSVSLADIMLWFSYGDVPGFLEVVFPGNDTVTGSDMNDRLYLSSGDDYVFGAAGDDEISGEDGNDNLDGGAGDDSIYGGEGDDVLSGGLDDDELDGGPGNDRVFGGPGRDAISIAAASGSAGLAVLDDGLLSVTSSDGTDTLSSVETLRFADREVATTNFAAIDAAYRSLGGRAASAFELILWADAIAGSGNVAGVRSAIINDALGASAIDAAYREGFGRSASGEEIAIWRGAFLQGSDLGTLRGAIASGVASLNATVNALYEDYGGRPANTFELNLWRGQLIAGVSPATIKSVIINDALGASAIDTAYQQGFGRSASDGEIAIWRGAFQQGADLDTLRAVILSQPAGQAHATAVIRASYQDYFGRAADDSDVSAWLGLFARGATTDTLRDTLMTHPAASAGGVARHAAGAGADTIVFNTEHLVVTGFDSAADTIDLRGSALGGSNPLAFAREVVSLDGRHDVLIDTAAHDILLTGVTLAQLSAGDFLI